MPQQKILIDAQLFFDLCNYFGKETHTETETRQIKDALLNKLERLHNRNVYIAQLRGRKE